METRILTEVEEMIKKVREKRGRPFDVTQLTTSCVVNVIMSMLFGHRFDHSDPAFQQLISDTQYLTANFSVALHLFPALRFLPVFKKSTAKKIEAVKRNRSFINRNVAACTVVCNCNLITVFLEKNPLHTASAFSMKGHHISVNRGRLPKGVPSVSSYSFCSCIRISINDQHIAQETELLSTIFRRESSPISTSLEPGIVG